MKVPFDKSGKFAVHIRPHTYPSAMKRPSTLFCALFFALSWVEAASQSGQLTDSTHQWLSIGVSSLAYKGDLGQNYSKWSGGFSAGLQFNTHKKWSGSVNLLAGTVTGQDTSPSFNLEPESGRTPNTYFKTSVISAYYQLHWNIYSGKRLRFFVGQGAGLLRYEPKNEEGLSLASQNNTRASNENYGSLTVLAPTSLGAAWKFKNNFGVGYRLTLFNTATDYLDNISQLGSRTGGDNVLGHQLSLMIPVYL